MLHLDAFSGVAGDMLVAALIDLGVPQEPIARALDALPLEGFRVGTEPRERHGIMGLGFVVEVTARQPPRRWREIRAMLTDAPLLDGVRQRALAAFAVLAEAEGRVHRTSPEDVHFHEVGAVDAIVDVVSASAALDWLGARVTASPLPMGRGFVKAAHGVLPVPAPAVVEVLRGVPTVEANVEAELVTPTGAALVRANATGFHRWPSMRPVATGFGAGTRDLSSRPNLLRAVLGEPWSDVDAEHGDTHVVLETNLDDASAQVVAHASEALLRNGALDAWTSPVGMKKGRAGVMLSALAPAGERERLGKLMLSESGSLGLRWRGVRRMERPRSSEAVQTPYGEVPVKVAEGDGLATQAQPEFDVCRQLAERAGVSVRAVHAAALAAWWGRRG
ncbi:MAG: nickel pincer cofactor biosynthesis protein LarC [Polyangiales bacterium]